MSTQIATKLELPESAKVWVYQSDRKFTSEEKKLIQNHLNEFVISWSSHGQELKAEYDIAYDQFVILGVDESASAASGCSIDSSVQIIRELEQNLNLNLLDKSQVAYLDKDQIKTIDFRKIKEAVSAGEITPLTPIFSNQVTTHGQLLDNWLVNAGDSWLQRFFS